MNREGERVSHPTYAARVTRIRVSPSLAAAARARELSAAGRDVLDLTLGEPDFDTPGHIKEAAIAAIEAGQTKYTPVNGTPELRQAIVSTVGKRTGIRYGDAEITVSGGAKQIIYLALAATLDRGDEVVIPAPYWLSYPDMVLANDGQPVIVPCPDTQGFLLTPEALDAAIGPRTRWVMLNAPGNPTGAAYTVEQLRALADVLLPHPQVGIISDEIYDAIYFGSSPLRSIVSVEPELADRTLVVNGVSKAYAMTGWRIGYAAGPKGLIAAMNKLQGQISTCPSSISQAAAAAALQGDQSPVHRMTEIYRKRRDLTVGLLNAIPGLTVVPPAGAFYLFPRCGEILGRRTASGTVLHSDEDVVLYLLDSAGVATVHGAAYGLSPHFRISFATSEHVLQRAVGRIADALADLR
jgi:aspartate aminotransferase